MPYVLVHELGHGITAILTGGKIEYIDLSLIKGEVENKNTLGCCSYKGGILSRNPIGRSFIAYSGELFTIMMTIIGGYLYGTGNVDIMFLIFGIMFGVYTFYGKEISDKILGGIITFLFISIYTNSTFDLEFLNFLKELNNKTLISYIGASFIGLMLGGSIINIFKLFGHIKDGSEINNDLGSDASQIKKNLFIPMFITYSSWIVLLLFSLILNYSMIMGKQTGVLEIDKKVTGFEKMINFERNIEKIDNYDEMEIKK